MNNMQKVTHMQWLIPLALAAACSAQAAPAGHVPPKGKALFSTVSSLASKAAANLSLIAARIWVFCRFSYPVSLQLFSEYPANRQDLVALNSATFEV